MIRLDRFGVLAAVSLYALALNVGAGLAAGGSGGPPDSRDPNPIKKESAQKRSASPSRNSATAIALAFQLVQAGDYKAAFAAFKALDADHVPDVANYLGYTARKLGDYELSKVWYERALASDPEARPHLAVLRHVAGRAGQQAQGRRLPGEDRGSSAATRAARSTRTSRAAWKGP
jgi:tetratricopeptide (TPR) repeat protein